METECSGDVLRALAPQWSLAGDEKLLDILQNTHKKIITKCQEVNSKLDQMTAELDEASISLQNVNNKFLALSNSQFIESRVYEDDADISTTSAPAMETPQKPQTQELDLEAIKNSLLVLQSLHETVTILKDSDTETDSDGEDGDRVVLKPKDLYSDRPLPYIIGSEAWKNSWHAGLIQEDSDSESGSAGREVPSPQYSDSEPEDTQVASKANATISETSSDIASEQDTPMPIPKTTPADIAADLARRLGAQQPKMKESEPPKTISKTVYRPQQPQTGTIFTDEPPPLDQLSESSEEDDIFAELHTSRPKDTRVVEDLFGARAFGDGTKIAPQPRIEHRALFEDDPDEFEDKPQSTKNVEEKNASKKPVGGISVFGTNKGAESIGAAILKRNQRKSSSEDETDSEENRPPPKSKTIDQTDSIKKEKDIFDDLFAKSANLEKKKQGHINKSESKNAEKDKLDLFSDNLFDDVNDLFTTNVMKNKSKQKSIFDDDDDDIFADITSVRVGDNINGTKGKNNKSIFDSDDELFADKSTVISNTNKESAGLIRNYVSDNTSPTNIDKTKPVTNTEKSTKSTVDKPILNPSSIISTKITENIFDSDSDSDIFSNIMKNKETENKHQTKDIFVVKGKLSDVEDTFQISGDGKKSVLKISEEINKMRSPSLFDDEDDALFGDTTSKVVQNTSTLRESVTDATKMPFGEEAEKSEFGEMPVESKPSKICNSGDTKNMLEKNENNVLLSGPENRQKEHIFESKENEKNDSMITSRNIEIGVPKLPYTDNTAIPSERRSELETNKGVIPSVIDDDIFIEKDSLFKIDKDPILKDIFDDEPPAFEKPKEPKRSKNVNALFDDDSEDEALFFRKSDMDDKSENFASTVQSDRLFGIFHNEPPAIDNFGEVHASDVFSSVSKSSSKNDISVKSSNQVDASQNIPPAETIKIMPENKVNHSNMSILETISTAQVNTDFNNCKTEKSVSHVVANKAKSIHDTFSELKENEFDDIFKAANKVVNDDISEVTIDDFINKAEHLFKSESIPENKPNDSGLFSSQLHENVPESAKSGIEFDSDEELFRTLPKPEKPKVPEISPSDDLEDKGALTSEHFKTNISNKLEDESIFKCVNKIEDNIEPFIKIKPKNEFRKSPEELLEYEPNLTKKENQSKIMDVKKVGRIKSLNLNIDVSTLLPGASPKKHNIETPKEKGCDTASDSTSEEVAIRLIPENDPKMVKSVSFEGEPNSDILDNKLSKERARIQVKRRPSTRRARREAVRKSAIDFDDSTDNSSSIDDPPKTVNRPESPSKMIDFKTAPHKSSSNILNADIKDSKFDNKNTNISDTVQRVVKDKDTSVEKVLEKPKVTSKVVYILNDEDIFDTKPKDKDNDLLKKDTPISTLGSMYAEVSKADTKSLIGDNAKKPSKVSIFDSDSDEELFGGKSKDKKRVEVKGSLFGDDDDDDLFGVKSKKTGIKPQTSKSASRETEKSEPVFNDPLSMLDDDE